MSASIIVGTFDTKAEELLFVRSILQQAGMQCITVDVSTQKHSTSVDVPAEEVASYHTDRPGFLGENSGRGDAVACMSEALPKYLLSLEAMDGVIGLGGSGGTAIITAGMRELPVGLPKVMVSTVASGNVAPYVGATDIFMVYSITDIAGINQISNTILGNAANALVGMVQGEIPDYEQVKPMLGITMFGVTTPCVTHIRSQLESDFECLVFHATGTGGKSMEKLVASGLMPYVIDITTTEICDLHMGGVMSAGEERMDAIIHAEIPYFLSVGALDMVNFGAPETLPEKYADRLIYKHNPQVTLMRTTVEENINMATWMAKKLNAAKGLVRLYIPEKGLSALSMPDQAFYDPEADKALYDTLESLVEQNEKRRIIKLPYAINDPAFGDKIIADFRSVAGQH